MPVPTDRVYSETHEWHKVEGEVVTVGLTQHAVDQLTDITYVDLKNGTEVEPGDVLGEVESVKTTADVYAACGGKVIEVNRDLESNPGLINEDPYGKGWLAKIRMTSRGKLDQCFDAARYQSIYPD